MVEIGVFPVPSWNFPISSWKLESFLIKGKVNPLYPVFHPTSIHSGQIPASLWVPGWGTYKRNILGAGVGT
jgi:hypothetical protein